MSGRLKSSSRQASQLMFHFPIQALGKIIISSCITVQYESYVYVNVPCWLYTLSGVKYSQKAKFSILYRFKIAQFNVSLHSLTLFTLCRVGPISVCRYWVVANTKSPQNILNKYWVFLWRYYCSSNADSQQISYSFFKHITCEMRYSPQWHILDFQNNYWIQTVQDLYSANLLWSSKRKSDSINSWWNLNFVCSQYAWATRCKPLYWCDLTLTVYWLWWYILFSQYAWRIAF